MSRKVDQRIFWFSGNRMPRARFCYHCIVKVQESSLVMTAY